MVSTKVVAKSENNFDFTQNLIKSMLESAHIVTLNVTMVLAGSLSTIIAKFLSRDTEYHGTTT